VRPFEKTRAKDRDTRSVQDSTERSLRQIGQASLIDGRLITGVVITSGAVNVVEHGLGRAHNGWLVVGQDTPVMVWDEQVDNPVPARTLRLQATDDVTLSLWVF
jgi:hypothetical protein